MPNDVLRINILKGNKEKRTFRGPARSISSIKDTDLSRKLRPNYAQLDREYKTDKENNFIEIQKHCLKTKSIFVDYDFPAGPRSLGNLHTQRIIWKRPQNFCKNPEFFVDGFSRFDVTQGAVGDCWLLAAIQSLSQNKLLFHQVVPEQQNYYQDYCGAFHFNFWRYGKWTEVIVDDLLPTINDKPVFMHSKTPNEFWSALLEKAYAKLMGGYDSLQGGNTIEAMTDMTGGISENILLKSVGNDFFYFLMVAKERGSLCGCAVDPNVYNCSEERLPTGLVTAHAYSLTDVKEVKTKSGNIVQLLRIMNPWGSVEWKGHWSDNSMDWNLVDSSERRKLGIEFSEDGEFWMSYKEWLANFTRVQICHLGPDSLTMEDSAKFSWKSWNATIEHSAWVRRVNAGGCRNYANTFWTNPQYSVSLTESDNSSGDTSTMIVSLLQKHDRSSKKPLLSIGYSIFRIASNMLNEMLPKEFFVKNKSVGQSVSFVNRREISERHVLPVGHYVIIPSTFEPYYESEFVLRIFSVKKSSTRELDISTQIKPERPPRPSIGHSDVLKRAFLEFAGSDEVVDAFELQKIINILFKDLNTCEVSLEAARAIVASCDENSDGTLGFEEFVEMWTKLQEWRTVFKRHDKDNSYSLDSSEFRIALKSAGFNLCNALISSIIIRYSNRNGDINFSDFLLCMCRIVRFYNLFKKFYKNGDARFSLDEFLSLSTLF